MSELIKYTLEFPINSSINILYLRLSSPSGLSEWFADDIIIKDNIYTFIWDDSEQNARLLKKKKNSFIRFKWEDNETQYDYFEFFIQVDEMTSDVSLLVTDFAEDKKDQEEQTYLWTQQISMLKQAIGS
ncbi:START-like domain-containing protein [Flavobacteriales bacterium]|nr:START-like domain-containing protein [Flavobacteriales bacterium]